MKEWLKKLVQPDFLAALFFRGSGVILSFALNMILARKYGPTLSGEYYTFYNFLALAGSIAFMGFGYVIVHRLTPYYSDTSPEMHSTGNTLLSISIYTLLFSTMIVSLPVMILSKPLSQYLCNSYEYQKSVILVALCMLPYIATIFIAEMFKALKKPNHSILIANILVNAFLILFSIVNQHFSVNALLLLLTIANVISFLLMLLSSRSMLNKNGVAVYSLRRTFLNYQANSILSKQYLKENVQLSVISIANVIINVFDTIVIAGFLTSADVAIYSVANKVVSFGSIILTTVNTIIGYKISELSYCNDKNALKSLLIKYTKMMMPLGVLYYAFAIVFSFCIPLLFDNEYTGSIKLALLLAIGQFVTIVTGPCAYFLIMTGHTRKYQNITIITAALTILLNYILVYNYGIIGSVISSIIVLTYKNVATFICANRTVNIGLRAYIIGGHNEH